MKTSRLILIAAMLAFTTSASAQQAAQSAPKPQPQPVKQQQLTPEQQAQVTRQNAEMSKFAAQVIQLVDQNRVGEVWDGASAVAKSVVGKSNFVGQIAADRQKLGAPTERKQVGVTRAAFAAGGQVPAGNYINVVYATKFANAPKPVRELVSFHLDNDKTWRVSGYSLR
jgi:glucose/arabinose dehydrogenase